MIRLSQRQLLAIAVVLGTAIAISFVPAVVSAGLQQWFYLIAAVSIGALLFGLMGAGGPSLEPTTLLRILRQLREGEKPSLPHNLDPSFFPVFDALLELGSQRRGPELKYLLEATRQATAGSTPSRPGNLDESYEPIFDALDTFVEQSKRRLSDGNTKLAAAGEIITNLSGNSEKLADTVQAQFGAIEEVVKAAQEVSQSINSTSKQVETLASGAEESSSSILEITATNDEVAENVGELAQSVRETVSSIEEMAYSIKEVAKNVEALSLTAEETSSSMNQMDLSIDQVQSNANETARLSEEVAQDAERGAEAILKTISEIYRIKESSQEAVSVIASLGSRIEAIGQIVGVIDEVAEQTNLLALNAAILAAQSGEHGKGFAVVADEIKDLAERAGGSTKEIADLVKTIQSESKNAISAVERSSHNVDRGVEVSNEAERALKKILESSQKSTNMVRAIARATVEQAKGSRQVTDAIGRIAETVQQIAAATAEQARGSELIMKSADKMRGITQHVERSSQEQSRGSRQITQTIESITGMISQLNNNQRVQTHNNDTVLSSVSRIQDLTRTQQRMVAHLQSLSLKLSEKLDK